jgi:hypothetical protein
MWNIQMRELRLLAGADPAVGRVGLKPPLLLETPWSPPKPLLGRRERIGEEEGWMRPSLLSLAPSLAVSVAYQVI